MEARWFRTALAVAALASMGASYRTQNFVVNAPTPHAAEQIGKLAEKYRRDLATLWLGNPLPNWAQPCPITAQVADGLGAGGATSFMFDRGLVFGWQMTIQGSLEKILDSVLPHEITHTVFADHFRRPLPRWADEGACTTVEHPGERVKQQQMLIQFLRTGRGIPFHSMFAMKEYPQDVLPLYAQGHSLASFLIQQGGRKKFLQFVGAGMRGEQWPQVTKEVYGYADLAVLQSTWLDWVRKGSPPLEQPTPETSPDSGTQLAQADVRPRPSGDVIFRGQSADPSKPAPASGRSAPNIDAALANNRERPQADDLVPVAPRAPLGQLASAAEMPGPGDWSNDHRQPSAAASGQNPAAGPSFTQSTRPQPPEPARQVILEWDQGVPANPNVDPARLIPPRTGGNSQSVYAVRNGQPAAAQ